MKPYIHALSSSKLFGGQPEDYVEIHQWFDESKAHFPDNRHRALRHHTQGIFEAERIFGKVKVNSAGKQFSIRDIGEQHVEEDLGFIPTLADYFQNLEYQDWMSGKGTPPSSKKVEKLKAENPPLNIIVDGLNPDPETSQCLKIKDWKEIRYD